MEGFSCSSASSCEYSRSSSPKGSSPRPASAGTGMTSKTTKSSTKWSSVREESSDGNILSTEFLPLKESIKKSSLPNEFYRQLPYKPQPLNHVAPVTGPERFSNHHPMIPKHYVPPWQLDMKNRYRIIENCQASDRDVKSWGGHISHFWEKRERLNVTSHGGPSLHLTDAKRIVNCHPLSSPRSKYNAGIIYYRSALY